MAVTSTLIVDGPDVTLFRDVDNTTGAVTLRAIPKTAGAPTNYAALINGAGAAIATLNTAESILQAGGSAWDNATPAQRTALMLGLVRDMRAVIRLMLGALDSPS